MAGKRKRKTFMMTLIEYQHNGKSIEDILTETFQNCGTEREAAQVIGITQQTFNQWKYRLGLEEIIQRRSTLDNDSDDETEE